LELERPLSILFDATPTVLLFRRIRAGGTNMRAEYVWEKVYKAAMLETNVKELPNRIQAAKAAIDDRLYDLQQDHGGAPQERQATAMHLQG